LKNKGADVRLIQRALELLGGDGGGKVEAHHHHGPKKGKEQKTAKWKAHGLMKQEEAPKWKAHRGLPPAPGSS